MLTGEIVDADSGDAVAARVYLQSQNGEWFFLETTAKDGAAIRYEKSFWKDPKMAEKHTILSPHPFRVELEPGRYTLTIERGKEYFPLSKTIEVSSSPSSLKLPLNRWINLAERGWFSGDMHNHRLPTELPTILMAEDLNVGLPISFWTRADNVPPSKGNDITRLEGVPTLHQVDASHVIWPQNTEYEIFSTAGKSHTLGAFLLLNHRSVIELPTFPLAKVAERARAEGAIIDMDKHNWPWSLTIVPIIKPDLFELTNNHLWRIEFGAKGWADPAPPWMEVGSGLDSERDWMLFGFQTYYALLNCGFRLSPSAGTASGVHPVPLGFGRVYVHVGKEFDYDAWIKGLKNGLSFVTTGPMLLAEVNGQFPGHQFQAKATDDKIIKITGSVLSEQPVSEVEFILNGSVIHTIPLKQQKNRDGAFEARFSQEVTLETSSWLIVRCFEPRENGRRLRFAHTAPWYFELPGRPLPVNKREVEWIIQNVKDEIERSGSVIPTEGLLEYREALSAYEAIMLNAK